MDNACILNLFAMVFQIVVTVVMKALPCVINKHVMNLNAKISDAFLVSFLVFFT